MGTPLGPKYIPYTYMDPLGIIQITRMIPKISSGTTLEVVARGRGSCLPRFQMVMGKSTVEFPIGYIGSYNPEEELGALG